MLRTRVHRPPTTGLGGAGRGRRQHAWCRDDGSATVELVLLTPLLVGLLLFVVLCGRLVSVQLDVDAAAHDAARAASIARTVPTATTDARQAALATLAARNRVCASPTITVDTGGLRPGVVVTVTVVCQVPLSDLAMLDIGGSRAVSSTASSPVDVYRGTALGFGGTHAATRGNPSGGGPA